MPQVALHSERSPLLPQHGLSVSSHDADCDSDLIQVEEHPKIWDTFRLHRDDIVFGLCIAFGVVLWFMPAPSGLSPSGMHLLAVFASVMLALMNSTYPIALIISLALVILTLTQTFKCGTRDGLFVECWRCGTPMDHAKATSLSSHGIAVASLAPSIPGVYQCSAFDDGFKVAMSGFGHPIAWLITCAFHIGRAIHITKLGSRIALMLIHRWGGSVLGLGYAIFGAECLLAPFVPSNTARGGGIILPIVKSMTDMLGSTPTDKPELGRFLVLCGAHANLLISSLFITGAAPNPVVADIVTNLFPEMRLGFLEWTIGAIVPAGCAIAILPWLFLRIEQPEYDGVRAREQACIQLRELGPMSSKEIQLCGVLLVALALWMTGPITDLPEALVALMALVACLFLDIINWNDVINNGKAWDTFFWLSGMLVMAEQLSSLGASKWIGVSCASFIHSLNVPAIVGTVFLATAYFISSIFFSSITGHAVALAAPFFEAARAIGCPPPLIVPLLAYFSSLCASLTTFSTGSVVLYFAQGFASQQRWCTVGLLVTCIYFGLYYSIGMVWWGILWKV